MQLSNGGRHGGRCDLVTLIVYKGTEGVGFPSLTLLTNEDAMSPLRAFVFIVFVRCIWESYYPEGSLKREKVKCHSVSFYESDNLVEAFHISNRWLGGC